MDDKIHFELTTNNTYADNHISLEEILRRGWVNNHNVDNVVHEAFRMGYDIDKQYVMLKWKDWNTELEYFS